MRRMLWGSAAVLVALSVAAVGRPAFADGPAPIGVTVSPPTLTAYGQKVTVTGDPFPGAFGCVRGRILATIGAQQPSEAQVLIADVNLDQATGGAATWTYQSGVGFDDGLGTRTPFGSGTYTILLDCRDDSSRQAYYTTGAEFTVLASATTTTAPTTVASSSSSSSSSSMVATSSTLPGTTGSVDPSTATAGVTSITVRGGGFKAGATLQISLKTTPALALGSTTATDSGAYAASLKLPASAPAGSQQLVVTGPAPDGTSRATTASLTVVAGSAASSSGSAAASGGSGSSAAASGALPKTGADHASVEVMAGLTALTLGALLVGLSHPAVPAQGRHRRRRRSSW